MKPAIFTRIEQEQQRQRDIHGSNPHGPAYWLLIMTEEVGELAKAILQRKPREAFTELVQVAAVACSWLDTWHDIIWDESPDLNHGAINDTIGALEDQLKDNASPTYYDTSVRNAIMYLKILRDNLLT